MNLLKKTLLFFIVLFSCKVKANEIIIFSEEKIPFDISVIEYKKPKQSYMYRIPKYDFNKISLVCKVGGKEISKTIRVTKDKDFSIYALSKEGNGEYSIRYRGKGFESFNFLKLQPAEIISLAKRNEPSIQTKKKVEDSIDKLLGKKKRVRKKKKKSKILSNEYYNKLIEKLSYLDTDSEKMNLIDKTLNKRKKRLNSDQIVELLTTIDNEVVRFEVCKGIFKLCKEKQKLKKKVMDIFVYDYTRRQLQNFLN